MILLAYIVAIPANEIVIPTILMLTTMLLGQATAGEAGVLVEASTSEIDTLLHAGGWSLLTAINLMLFSLLHNPCSTTIYTIYKETNSKKMALIATFLPVLYGVLVCFFTKQSVENSLFKNSFSFFDKKSGYFLVLSLIIYYFF